MAEEDVVEMNIADNVNSAKINSGLSVQDLSKLDVDKIGVLTPEIMSRQATINIGTIGHVAHGKTTVVRALSDVKTQRYKSEKLMNITVHLGYANAKVFQCPRCPAPKCYHSFPSSQADKTDCPNSGCGAPMTLIRHFSLVDCPGHNVLMSTMLNGAAVMDAALLLIAANETFPQPQTLEHLKAVEIMHLTQLIVVQNKIDLVAQPAAVDQYLKIKEYLYNLASHAPVIPLCAQLKHNIEYLLEYMVRVPPPKRDLHASTLMTIIRSFDINKPSENIDDLCGGVVGGTVTRGILKMGQEIELRPGRVSRSASGGQRVQYLRSHVTSLKAENNDLQFAIPGGLIAVGTTLDPTLTRSNKMVGNVLGAKDTLPSVFSVLEVAYYLLLEVIGNTKKVHKVSIKEGDFLQLNVGSLTLGAEVTKTADSPPMMRLRLEQPVCCSHDERVAISSKVGGDTSFRLVGWGTIKRGTTMQGV